MKRYRINPERFPTGLLETLIAGRTMIPSRRSLKNDLHENFFVLEKAGIRNLKELFKALGNKKKIKEFSRKYCIGEPWLVLLKREAGSYISKPFPLEKFPGIPFEYTEALRSGNISSTEDFFERMQAGEDLENWSGITGIPLPRMKELYALCDLSRINGVGPRFARILYQAGFTSVEQVAGSDAETQLRLYEKARERSHPDLPALSISDIQYCIDFAKVIGHVV